MKVLVNSLVWLALQGLENTMEVTTASYTPLEELLVEKLLVPLLGLYRTEAFLVSSKTRNILASLAGSFYLASSVRVNGNPLHAAPSVRDLSFSRQISSSVACSSAQHQ